VSETGGPGGPGQARLPLEKQSVVHVGDAAGGPVSLDALFRPAPRGDSADAAPAGRGGIVLAPPHPLYGGSMASPVLTQLAFAAAGAGLASLRFDWRGVGASSGAASGDAADHDTDYAAALAHLAETVEGPLVAAGYSAGAAAAARVAAGSARVEGLLLVAPPPAMVDGGTVARFRGRLLIVVGEEDGLAPAATLRGWVEARPAARLVTLPDVDHFFAAGLSELAAAAATWLAGGRDPGGG